MKHMKTGLRLSKAPHRTVFTGNFWGSDNVHSDQNINVARVGRPLRPAGTQ
jgi:hypothetical protein